MHRCCTSFSCFQKKGTNIEGHYVNGQDYLSNTSADFERRISDIVHKTNRLKHSRCAMETAGNINFKLKI